MTHDATPGLFRTWRGFAAVTAWVAVVVAGSALLAVHRWIPTVAAYAVALAVEETYTRRRSRAARRALVADIDASRRPGEPREP